MRKILSDCISNEYTEIELTHEDVAELGKEGDTFDPALHSAVAHVDDESLGENVIAKVLQKGYCIGDKVIRHAMVQAAN